MTSNTDVVAALSISGNFRLEPCSHGDFLGAILGTGITREKVGDILLQGERGAEVLVDPELVDYLISTLEKVGKVGVSCTQIPLLALEYEPPRTKSFKTVESSLRVDALTSAGFKISRTKLASLISAGDVRVNWTPALKNGVTLKSGDIVSVSGMGRLKVVQQSVPLSPCRVSACMGWCRVFWAALSCIAPEVPTFLPNTTFLAAHACVIDSTSLRVFECWSHGCTVFQIGL
ncbi:uncharacterized protein LOC133920583 isoform X1 [Phragmites australis]|uniref:uncharacterized protein LOC133920583 isoform X1 n=1 Tax=Phragmites australis TaxID=29695 RepID=UPI002D78AF5F|nr:uncharacterized protein LOC133920583 isoform X1 [Phragmites australis]XP_062221180.1 uncharacterized protein LOC133920583 isoform X1 [Phragmites australis]